MGGGHVVKMEGGEEVDGRRENRWKGRKEYAVYILYT
jgi:hypothetical protein